MLVVTMWSATRPVPERPAGAPTGVAEAPPAERARDADAAPAGEPLPESSRARAAEQTTELPYARQPRFEPRLKTVEGTKFRATLSNRGGTLERYALLDYRTPGGEGASREIDLLGAEDGTLEGAATPFAELGIGDLRDAEFTVEDEDSRSVTYTLQRGGVLVRKRYRFDLDDYSFSLAVSVENTSGEVLYPEFEVEWPAALQPGNDYSKISLLTRHDGEVTRTPVPSVGSSGFLGIGGDDGSPLEGGVDWFGADTTYFVGALIPQRGASARSRFVALEEGKVAANVVRFDGIALPSGNKITQEFKGYIGPKIEKDLVAAGSDLSASIDRGWSWVQPLTRFFDWLLQAIYSVIPNYGWAIIVLTVLVRVVTYPILQTQMKSMEKMRAVQPRMKEIQEKYADDREKQSQAMMSLYKEEGVNPLGGCLPVLLQLPVFIGLFWSLQSSFELRDAPFILWMTDLSAPDQLFAIPTPWGEFPFRVLPILMAGSMVLQAKLQPMSPDPAQAQMMTTIMPIMMLFLFYQFPAGLVLYYALSNFLGIAHQRWVGRNMQLNQAT